MLRYLGRTLREAGCRRRERPVHRQGASGCHRHPLLHPRCSGCGAGLDSSLSLLVNGEQVASVPVTSRYSWRYGSYTFTNRPSDGNPRNFFDEVRLKGLHIRKGDQVRVVKGVGQGRCRVLHHRSDRPRGGPGTAPAAGQCPVGDGVRGQGRRRPRRRHRSAPGMHQCRPQPEEGCLDPGGDLCDRRRHEQHPGDLDPGRRHVAYHPGRRSGALQ